MLSFKVNGENGVLTKQLMQSMLNGNCDVIFNYYYFFFFETICQYFANIIWGIWMLMKMFPLFVQI